MPDPLSNNAIILDLINKYICLFMDGMGSIQANGIRLALEAEDLDASGGIIQKIVAYCSTAIKSSNKEINHGSQN